MRKSFVEKEAEFLDFGDYPIIRADDLAEIFTVGPKLFVRLFEWQNIDGILRKVICGEVRRPRTMVTPAQIQHWMERLEPEQAAQMRGH